MEPRSPEGPDRAARSPRNSIEKRPSLATLLILSAWCGLVAGLLEVGTIALRKATFDPNRLFWMSRHFVWLIPLTNLGIFLALGCFGCLVCVAWPRRGRWLLTRVLCAATILPVFLVGFPRIYGLASLVLALGIAARLVPAIAGHPRTFRRIVRVSAAAAVGILLLLAVVSLRSRAGSKQSRERSRPMPPSGSPNVLLIVLDTVAAGHLSLHGYERPTSTTLVELAEQGIRFDGALASSRGPCRRMRPCSQAGGCTSFR